jgi:CBS domain-containing protein
MTISDLMTKNPVTLDARSTAADAARLMKSHDIGDVVVVDGETVCGIVTDRDIVTRAVAENKNPLDVTLAEICSTDLTTLSPDDSVEDAVRLMTEHSLRRLPVVENGRPIGIVTLGDLAVEHDSDSALGEISAAPPNN